MKKYENVSKCRKMYRKPCGHRLSDIGFLIFLYSISLHPFFDLCFATFPAPLSTGPLSSSKGQHGVWLHSMSFGTEFEMVAVRFPDFAIGHKTSPPQIGYIICKFKSINIIHWMSQRPIPHQ